MQSSSRSPRETRSNKMMDEEEIKAVVSEVLAALGLDAPINQKLMKLSRDEAVASSSLSRFTMKVLNPLDTGEAHNYGRALKSVLSYHDTAEICWIS